MSDLSPTTDMFEFLKTSIFTVAQIAHNKYDKSTKEQPTKKAESVCVEFCVNVPLSPAFSQLTRVGILKAKFYGT